MTVAGYMLTAKAKASISGCPIFPEDNVWNTPIDTLPVDANSSACINTIGADNGVHPGWHSLPGATADAPAFAWNPAANKLQMVVRASNNTLWGSTFSSSGVFNNDWMNFPGMTASSPGMAYNPFIGSLDIVVRAADGSLWTIIY